MPLFGRKLVDFNRNDSTKNSDETFVIQHTGEILYDRVYYEKLMKIYQLERWTCQCTWRAGLTHEEAYLSELDTRKTLNELVPDYFHPIIFDIVYHNVKPLEKLAEEVSIILGQSFVLNEPVQFKKKKDSTVIKGFIERIEDNDETKQRSSQRNSLQGKVHKNVKYAIRLADDNEILENILPNELQRCSLIPNREKLKTFIRSYAIRLGNRADSPWIFYDSAIIEKYQLKSRISDDEVAKFIKSSTISLNEILREQDRIASKQLEINNNNTNLPEKHSDNDMIIVLTDESHLIPNEPKKPSKSKKQLTLDEMKFTKNPSSHNELIEKTTTADVVLPNSLLQKLDRTRRERGIDSKFFHRLILQCARTLNDKQRLRLPDEYRSLIQIKFDELEFKRRLSTMTDEEKKRFLQSKREEQKPIEDLDLTTSKDLPIPKEISTNLFSNSDSIGNLLMICTFCTSCQSLFSLAFDDQQLTKTTQIHLRSFQFDYLLNSSKQIFTNYFLEVLQIFMKLLFKEDENRSSSENDDEDEANDDDNDDRSTNESEQIDVDQEDNEKKLSSNEQMFEEIYSIQLSDIPLTPYTCQELTRLYLLKEKDETNQIILDKLSICEAKDLNTYEQLDLLLLLVNTITTDNELMADYFDYLTRTLSEASRERAERRKAYEEETKEKKLQLQNGEKEKVSTKKTNIISNINNDENQQMIVDENIDIDDDLKSVLQRRRQMVAMSKELKEKKELEAQKSQLKQKRQLALQKAEQIYQEALLNYQYGFRIKPLGYDRHYNRYWFFRGYPGLFVEKGWIGSNVNYSLESTDSCSIQEKLIPNDELNRWFFYDDENLIQQVYQSLNERGIREHNLLINFKKALPYIHQEFDNQKKSKLQINELDEQQQQQQNDIIQSFKNELEDIETRLRLGSLGGFSQNDWLNKLKQTNQRSDLADLLIQLQQTVADKYQSENFNNKCQQIWMNDCRTCETYSRLYVLMIIFENSITWNKSTLGMKCKICRKKSKDDDDDILVCDQCCFGFHQECLRNSKDSAKKSSNNLWYCLSCRPKTKPQKKTKSIINQNCSICGDENDLIHCTQCQRYYHCQCHEPPLRCPPRSNTWTCNHCRNQRSKRKNFKDNQSSNDDEEEEEENDLDDDSRIKRRSKRLRQSEPSPIKSLENRRRKTRSMKSISSDDDQTSLNNSELENDSNDSPSSTN